MSTYTPIASLTLASATSSITLTSIPQTYTDLVLVCNIKGDSGNIGCNLQFNGDTNSNYSTTQINANGSPTTGTNRYSNQTAIFTTSNYTSGTNQWTTVVWNIPNYNNTTTDKVILSRYSRATYEVSFQAGLYRSTNAISSITLSPIANSFTTGSTFMLYGISANDGSTPKATGGSVVVSDGTYWYHAFKSSGTFTPNQSLTADVMIIAGGGGGGWSQTGGGGAGGLSALSSQALTAQNYSVIIGAGGAGAYANAQTVAGNNSSFGAFTAAIGGGKGGNNQNGNVGGNGGCGGGAQGANGTKAGGTGSQGFNGGSGSSNETTYRSTGGGGGLGAAGSDGGGTQVGGAGGNGITSYSSWGLATGTGQNSSGTVYFGGGGGGGQSTGSTPGAAGLGGGGAGSNSGTNPGNSGSANTGGGAGSGGTVGGSGGSGIVIVRYTI